MDTKDTKSTKVILVVAFISFVVLGLFVYQWWSNPERTIRNRLRDLAQTLSVPDNAGDLGRLTRLTQLRHYLAEDVHVRARASGLEITSRDALLGMIAGWTPPPGGWTIEFVDVQVTLGQESTTAQAYLTVKVSGHDVRTGEPTVDAREANLRLVKRDGDWLVTSVDAAERLTKP